MKSFLALEKACEDSNQEQLSFVMSDKRLSMANIPQELFDVFNMEACRGNDHQLFSLT